jgi:DNA-binding transcriptional MerR regulator
MRIGAVARRAGVPAKTIRFWEDRRLGPTPSAEALRQALAAVADS